MTEAGTELELSQELIDLMMPMVSVLPDFEPGTGDDIMIRLLKAKSIEETEDVFKGRGLPMDVPIIITDLAKAPSDYAGGLGFYIVINAITPHNGEQAIYNTGSQSILGQLLSWHAAGELPVRCIARRSTKKTRAGFYPQQLTEVTRERPVKAGK